MNTGRRDCEPLHARRPRGYGRSRRDGVGCRRAVSCRERVGDHEEQVETGRDNRDPWTWTQTSQPPGARHPRRRAARHGRLASDWAMADDRAVLFGSRSPTGRLGRLGSRNTRFIALVRDQRRIVHVFPRWNRRERMILPRNRDPRLVTVRRGGTLLDADHRLLALWAADCAEHVLNLFEQARPGDDRPRRAIEQTRAWVRGECTMTQGRAAAGAANDAAREAAHAAGQAAVVAHVAAHELGAAAYAIRAVRAAAPKDEREEAGRGECRWQRAQLPDEIRELVLDDQRVRNEVCWFVFEC